MVKRRKTKAKSKKKSKSTPKVKKMTELNSLKKSQNDLHIRVIDNLKVIMKNTGMSSEQLGSFVRSNGYDGLRKLPTLEIAEPIFNQMIKTFQLYDKIGYLITRLEQAENKLLITGIEEKTVELEAKVKLIEEQEKFYTELPDKNGFVKLKEKWFAEKNFWELKKAEAEATYSLQQDPLALEQIQEAERQLKILDKKKSWARMKNIQPNISKWTGKITKGISTIQNSMGEISKPFAEIGSVGDGKSSGTKNQFEDFFGDTTVKNNTKKANQYENFFGKVG